MSRNWLKKADKLVIGPELAGLAVEGDRLGGDLLSECKIGVEIGVCGLDGFASQPRRDDRLLDAGVEQVHRRRVAQAVEGDVVTQRNLLRLSR